MDLNELLKRHQIALIDTAHATTASLRDAAEQRVTAFARRIDGLRPQLLASDGQWRGLAS